MSEHRAIEALGIPDVRPGQFVTKGQGKRLAPERNRPQHPAPPGRPGKSSGSGIGSSLSNSRAERDEHVGKIFGGKYRIERLLAKGGMGRVYQATQLPLERPVAIKVLNKEFQRSDPQFVRRFCLEAATAAKLSHPHTITIFDYGESETGDLYIAMELLKGRTLSRVIATEGPLGAERTLRIVMQVARAVREAHELGIIHRDLKPGNIFLVEEGEDTDYAKVLDFGLVKVLRPDGEDEGRPSILGDADAELTRTGTLLGSPKYMSPEQIQGHPLDPRTDIYSLGVIMFQMITGKPPFTGATGVDIIYRHVHQPAPTVDSVVPNVDCPPMVEAIIQRCLAKSREQRFASMSNLIEELKHARKLVAGISNSTDSLVLNGRPEFTSSRTGSVLGRRGGLSRGPSGSLGMAMPGGFVDEAREFGLREPGIEEPTPAVRLGSEQDAGRIAVRYSRMPLALSLLGCALAAATLAYVLWNPGTLPQPRPDDRGGAQVPAAPAQAAPAPATAPAQAGTAAPATLDMQVRFTSEPSGARVFDGAEAIGTTPFSRAMPVDQAHHFVFRKDGFGEATRDVTINPATAAIGASLEPLPAPSPDSVGPTDDAEEIDAPRVARKVRKVLQSAPAAKPVKKEREPPADPRYRHNPY